MQTDPPDISPAYAATLVVGAITLVLLGLLGLPLRTLIPVTFGGVLAVGFLYAAWEVLAHRRSTKRRRRGGARGRTRPRPAASRRPGVAPAAAHHRRPARRRSGDGASV